MKVTRLCCNLEIYESPSVPKITFLWADEIYVIYLLKKNKPPAHKTPLLRVY